MGGSYRATEKCHGTSVASRPDIFCISPTSRSLARRIAHQDVERDLVLETLSNTRGNRTATARVLGVSVRTLRNKITEYSAEGVDVPKHENQKEIRNWVEPSQ
jgi:DNA-binding NtrC family response regulator